MGGDIDVGVDWPNVREHGLGDGGGMMWWAAGARWTRRNPSVSRRAARASTPRLERRGDNLVRGQKGPVDCDAHEVRRRALILVVGDAGGVDLGGDRRRSCAAVGKDGGRGWSAIP